jgi:uncharacterized Fe-S cluster-containing MiaB family protein
LRKEGIEVRAFVLVQPPYMDDKEAVAWAVKSTRFAFECGVGVVSLIPTRPGNGAMEKLIESGDFSPPRLSTLERALEEALVLQGGRVFADTWNLELFSSCGSCLRDRERRLQRMNLEQRVLPPVACPACGVGLTS